MSDAINIFRSRRSCKHYDGRPVSEEQLSAILEAGEYAPSGMNKQSAVMLAVRDRELIKKLSRMNAQVMGADIDPFYGAATVVIVLADKNVSTYLYDGSLVMGNLLNAAEAVGVQGCWIHRAKQMFETEDGKEILKKAGIKGDYEGIGCCILGYGEKQPEKPRKDNYVYYL